jgi:Tetratricopeptide repeat.
MDSLFTELKKWQNKTGYQADTTLYNIYYNLGIQFQKSNPDTAIYFLKQSITKAENIKDAIKQAESIKATGWCYYIKGDYNLAMQQYELALKVLPENVNKKKKFGSKKYMLPFSETLELCIGVKATMSRHWSIISRH